MGFLRGCGYFIGIVIIIVGILALPFYGIGIPVIVVGAIMIWALKKGGQVSSMQKELKEIHKIESQNQMLKLKEMRMDALQNREALLANKNENKKRDPGSFSN